MGRRCVGDGATGREAAAMIVVLVLLGGLQVGWAQKHHCFRLNGLRLLANLIEAIKPSAYNGTHTPMPYISLQKLNVWLHMLPDTIQHHTDVNITSETVVGKLKMHLNHERKILEVSDFPAKLEIIPKYSRFSWMMKKTSVPLTEYAVRPETILRGLDIIHDDSSDSTMVRVSVNPWTSGVSTNLRQINVILRTHEKPMCEIDVPRSLQEASKLLKSIANIAGNFHVEEIAIVNSASLHNLKLKYSMPPKCEKLLGIEPRRALAHAVRIIPISEPMKVVSWMIPSGTVRVGPQLASMLLHSWHSSAHTAAGKSRPPHPPVVEIRACLSPDIVKLPHIPEAWKQVIKKVMDLHGSGQKGQHLRPHLDGTGSSADEARSRALFPGGIPGQLRNVQLPHGMIVAPVGVMYNGLVLNNIHALNSPQESVSRTLQHPPFQIAESAPPKQVWLNQAYVSIPEPVSLPPAKWPFYSDDPPPPTSVLVNNMLINIQPEAPNSGQWPLYSENSPPPRFVWMGNKWEPVVNKSVGWVVDPTLRPSQWPLPDNITPKSLFALLNGTWILLSTPNLLWNQKTNSFRPPEQIFPSQTSSPHRFIWLQNKWEKVSFMNNIWSVAPSDQIPNSQTPADQVYALINGVWVLVPSSYIFLNQNNKNELDNMEEFVSRPLQHPPFQISEPAPPKQVLIDNTYVPVPPPVSLPPAKWPFYSDDPPPPTSVSVNNTMINITTIAPNPVQWPFYPEKSPPPRFVWMNDMWEPVVNKSDRWEVDPASRPSQWPLPDNTQPKSVLVLVNGTWTLLSTPNLLWSSTTNSFRPPEQIFQPQEASPPRFAWLQNKWEKVSFMDDIWLVDRSHQTTNPAETSQTPADQVYALVNGVWVLIPSNYIPTKTVNTSSPTPTFSFSEPQSTNMITNTVINTIPTSSAITEPPLSPPPPPPPPPTTSSPPPPPPPPPPAPCSCLKLF